MALFSARKFAFVSSLLIASVLHPSLSSGQQLTVITVGGKQTVLTRADLEALPHVKVTTGSDAASVTFEGVVLKTVLEKAGIAFGEALKGKGMASCLLVQAADEYRVVFALPELDPAFTEKQIVLAFLKDGKALDGREGPYRLVIPDEKRMARWARQITTLKIVDVQ
jgi:hypothetical protein